MKRLLIFVPLVFLYCLGCQQGENATVTDVEADIQAIKDMVAKFNDAVNAANIDELMSFYADDAVEIPPSEPAIIGKGAIRKNLQELLEEMTPHEEYVVKSVHVGGDLAVAHVTWASIAMNKNGVEQIGPGGNWIANFEKQPDASWKCIYSIFSDESLVRPSKTE